METRHKGWQARAFKALFDTYLLKKEIKEAQRKNHNVKRIMAANLK
jgi:hypothetical protein